MAYEWIDRNRLLRYFKKYSVTYTEFVGWETRAAYGPDTRNYTPVGILNHHTAGTNWYAPERLLRKCNFYIDPAGITHILSAGYQADSGMGDPNVLMRVRNDQAPMPPLDYSADDRINGNPWYIDIEVGHLGDGSPIPEVQRDELIRVNAALCEMYGWNPYTRLLAHKEWTRRKIDPMWEHEGQIDLMEYIRADTVELLVTSEEEIMEYLKADLHAMVDAAFDVGGAQGNRTWWHEYIDDMEAITPEELQAELYYLYRELFD